MGFWDKDVNGSFDELFDFDRDGKLDITEQGLQYSFLEREYRRERRDSTDDLELDDLDDSDEDEISDEYEDEWDDTDDDEYDDEWDDTEDDEYDDDLDDGFDDDF